MRQNQIIFLFLILLSPLSLKADLSDSNEKNFYFGVYIYEYHFEKLAQETNRKYRDVLEDHIKVLTDHQINAVYLGGVSQKRFDDNVYLAQKYNIKLIPQLDFAYFQPDWTDIQRAQNAAAAGAFINKYNDPNLILAWSVKEEASPGDMLALLDYCTRITKYAPDAKFNIVHNTLASAKKRQPDNLSIMGTDRYGFWWEFSGGGYLAPPDFALNWTREQSGQFYDQAARNEVDFMMVITQGGLLMPRYANIYAGQPDEIPYPNELREKINIHNKILSYAKQNRMGWREIRTWQKNIYSVWKYYRLPQNCMKSLAWISVLEGAKMFFCWHYRPYSEEELNRSFTDTIVEKKMEQYVDYWNLASKPDKPNPQLEELEQVAKEIKAYEEIICRMQKMPTSIASTDKTYMHHNSFSFPGLSGRLVVFQNSNVGTWPGKGARLFKEDEDIRIDDEGCFLSYTPYQEPEAVIFTLKGTYRQMEVYNLSDKTVLDKNPNDNSYTLQIKPGGGVLVFVGKEQEAVGLYNLIKK
jgi:hypothetical protein